VTGCTRGIGDAFCCELASYRMNILLVGRNENQLTELSQKLGNSARFINLGIPLVI